MAKSKSMETQLKELIPPKYRGWIGLVVILFLLAGGQGSTAAVGSIADLTWIAIWTPSVCGAVNKDAQRTRCGHNAAGMLRGCGLQAHKEQRVHVLLRRDWAEVLEHLRRNSLNTALVGACLCTLAIGGLEAAVSAMP